MVKNIFILLAAVMLVGCEPTEYVPVTDYATTNTPPSRFKVVSSDYYRMGGFVPNFSTTVLTDTKGTNDILVVQSEHGLSMMYITKPEVQAEDWRK